MYAELTQKTCTKCTRTKPIAEFIKNSRYRDGYVTWCKSCKNEHARNNPHINANWVKNNQEASLEIKTRYVKNNPDKVRESKRKWSKANHKKELAKVRKYQASKIQATPKWLSKAQIKLMEDIYINCPEGYHVDHIIPLRGKNVRGLHVPWNLQYLLAEINWRKSNKC